MFSKHYSVLAIKYARKFSKYKFIFPMINKHLHTLIVLPTCKCAYYIINTTVHT